MYLKQTNKQKKTKTRGNDCIWVCRITFVRVHIATLFLLLLMFTSAWWRAVSFRSWLMRCVCGCVCFPGGVKMKSLLLSGRVCLCCSRSSLAVKDWRDNDPLFGSSHSPVTPQTHRCSVNATKQSLNTEERTDEGRNRCLCYIQIIHKYP